MQSTNETLVALGPPEKEQERHGGLSRQGKDLELTNAANTRKHTLNYLPRIELCQFELVVQLVFQSCYVSPQLFPVFSQPTTPIGYKIAQGWPPPFSLGTRSLTETVNPISVVAF